MYKINYFFLAVILVFTQSCNTADSSESSSSYELKDAGLKSINIGSDFYPKSNASFLKMINGKEYLLYLEKGKNNISVIDFGEQQVVDRIKVEFTGPNGLGEVRGFYFHNFDSLFITPKGDQTLYLVDSSGVIMNTYDYNKTSLGEEVSMPSYSKSNVNNEIVVNKGVAYLTIGIPGNPTAYTPEQLMEFEVGIEIDLDTKETRMSKAKFPKAWSQQSYPLDFSRVFDGDKFVFSSLYSKTIMVSGTMNKWDKAFELEPTYFSGFAKPMPSNPDFNDMLTFYISSPRIQNLFFDNSNGLYYVVVLNGECVDAGTNLQQEMGFESNLSVIVLNSDFEKVGETKLPNKMHLANEILLTTGGLYFSNHHKDNPGYSDNQLSYTLYKVTKTP